MMRGARTFVARRRTVSRRSYGKATRRPKNGPRFSVKGGEKMRLGLNLSTLDEAHDAFCVAIVAVWIIMARKTVAKQQTYGLV